MRSSKVQIVGESRPMQQLWIFSDHGSFVANSLHQAFAGKMEIRMAQLAQIPDVPLGNLTVVDAGLEDGSGLTNLKTWMDSSTRKNTKLILAIDTASPIEVTKA